MPGLFVFMGRSCAGELKECLTDPDNRQPVAQFTLRSLIIDQIYTLEIKYYKREIFRSGRIG